MNGVMHQRRQCIEGRQVVKYTLMQAAAEMDQGWLKFTVFQM